MKNHHENVYTFSCFFRSPSGSHSVAPSRWWRLDRWNSLWTWSATHSAHSSWDIWAPSGHGFPPVFPWVFHQFSSWNHHVPMGFPHFTPKWIWVTYTNSLTWIVRPQKGDDVPYSPMIPVRENSEVVVIYPDGWFIHRKYHDKWLTFGATPISGNLQMNIWLYLIMQNRNLIVNH